MRIIKYKQKLKAFTLTELIVIMVISSFVIILSYSVVQMINHYFIRSSHSNTLNAELLGFRATFAKDLDQCDSVKHLPLGLILYRSNQEIIWTTDSNFIVRETIIKDEPTPFRFEIGTVKISSSESEYGGLVGLISFELLTDNDSEMVLRFKKSYSLETIVNRGIVTSNTF